MPTYATPAVTGQMRDKTDELIHDLSSCDPHVRQAACQGLGRETKTPSRAVPPLLNGIQDQNSYVRLAAATSLGQVARKGDEEVLEALIARFSDTDASVRRVACAAAGQVSNKSNARVLSALLARSEDRDGGVRRSAVKALEKVAKKEDPQVLAALFQRSNDSEAFVRYSAVEALCNLAAEGSPEVVNRMLELQSDRDSRVRCCATEALGRLAVRGDSRVLTSLLQCLDDEADAVRRAAATSLGYVTFAPLQELEVQERQIAELEFREQHEVSTRDRIIAELREKHQKESTELRARIFELEDQLKLEVEKRDLEIQQLKHKLEEQEWIAGVAGVIPHSGEISKFLDTLPDLAGAEHYGKQILAPIWALRCLRVTQPSLAASENSVEAKDKRSMLALFELFQRLSSGSVTPLELTEASPLDVFVHQLEDGTWGLFCSSRQRLLAFIMRQACHRNELMRVRCTIRSKEDLGYWSWHWNCFYDGNDGRTMSPKGGASPSISPSASCRRSMLGFSVSSPRLAGSSPSTPRSVGFSRGARPCPRSAGEIQSSVALAAATSALGAQACAKSPRAFGLARSKSAPKTTSPRTPRPVQRLGQTVPTVSLQF
ncbi:unnamed protein product [Durusdinium trenchii]|uniref:Uncharacterized protein n=1 Tax=Durusdinium trenchii TaxID=1381693 RepID=A0ABP0HLJ0_9DINO